MQGERFIPALSDKRRGYLLIVSIAAALCFSQAVLAQSGRHPNKSASAPLPPVPVEPAKNSPATKPQVHISSIIVAGEIVHNYDYFRSNYLDETVEVFKDRMKHLPRSTIEVTKGGSMSLNEAKERAKKETQAYVLWLEFMTEDDGWGDMSITFINYALLIPQTAKFLTWGKIYPGQESIRGAGKVLRVPSPTRRKSALSQMRDATREVAERLIFGGWL